MIHENRVPAAPDVIER